MRRVWRTGPWCTTGTQATWGSAGGGHRRSTKAMRRSAWCRSGSGRFRQFGWVHAIRNAAGANIDLNGLGTPEHVAPGILRDLYGSAKEVAKETTKRAGGVMPVVSAGFFRDP